RVSALSIFPGIFERRSANEVSTLADRIERLKHFPPVFLRRSRVGRERKCGIRNAEWERTAARRFITKRRKGAKDWSSGREMIPTDLCSGDSCDQEGGW